MTMVVHRVGTSSANIYTHCTAALAAGRCEIKCESGRRARHLAHTLGRIGLGWSEIPAPAVNSSARPARPHSLSHLVYNSVSIFVIDPRPAGTHTFKSDSRQQAGSPVTSGGQSTGSPRGSFWRHQHRSTTVNVNKTFRTHVIYT